MSWDARWVMGGRYRLLTPITGMSIASTGDKGSWETLSSKYLVLGMYVFDASATPIAGAISLRTAASGAGTAIINSQLLTALTSAAAVNQPTLAVTNAYQTAPLLYFNVAVLNVAACTVSAAPLILDLA